jgi:hypothetical protein
MYCACPPLLFEFSVRGKSKSEDDQLCVCCDQLKTLLYLAIHNGQLEGNYPLHDTISAAFKVMKVVTASLMAFKRLNFLQSFHAEVIIRKSDFGTLGATLWRK